MEGRWKAGMAVAVVLGMAAVAVLSYRLGANRAPSLRPGGSMPGEPPAMTEWYWSDGIVNLADVSPETAVPGMWSVARATLVVFNPGERETPIEVTFYFAEQRPRVYRQTLPPRVPVPIRLHHLDGVVPKSELYGARLVSEEPVIVQPTRGEFRVNNPTTEAMSSSIAYPGPLGRRETKWAYADGLVIASEAALEEWEWISILNPGSRDAQVAITFYFADGETAHFLTVPGRSVRTVDLFNLPVVAKNELFSPIVESDVPVVVQQVRRAYTRGIPLTDSLWACLAYPFGTGGRRSVVPGSP